PRRRRRRRALAGDARAPRPLRPGGRARARAPRPRAARRRGLHDLRDDLHRALVPDVRRPEHPHVGGGLSPTQPGPGDASHERGSRPISVTAGLFGLAGASILLTLGAFELGLRWLGYEPIYKVYSHPEIFWRRDELLGWSHEPNSEAVYV